MTGEQWNSHTKAPASAALCRYRSLVIPRPWVIVNCRSCRSWSAGPVNAFTLWALTAITISKGQKHIATYRKSDLSHRQFCRLCGGHLMTIHPPLNIVDVFAATIPDLPFVPQVHVNYGETVLSMRDGARRQRGWLVRRTCDPPPASGGSGKPLLV
jgi:hypothetical protein